MGENGGLTVDLMWWISAVELPALAGLFWLLWRTRHDMDEALDDTRHRLEMNAAQLRNELASYKLEVAKTYASIAYLKDVEQRLIDHLLRIEGKLDSADRRRAAAE